jgi:hypothetical protein
MRECFTITAMMPLLRLFLSYIVSKQNAKHTTAATEKMAETPTRNPKFLLNIMRNLLRLSKHGYLELYIYIKQEKKLE